MAVTTTSQITQPVNVMFQQRLLRVARARCAHFKGTMPGIIQSHVGTFTVNWRRHDELTPTTTAISELTGTLTLPTRTASQVTVTDVQATVSKYGDFVYLTEEADLVNFNGNTDGIILTLGIQAGRSLNRLQRNVSEDNFTLLYPAGAAADGDVAEAITRNQIRLAVNTLQRNSALMFTSMTTGDPASNTMPTRPAYWGICHSDVEEDIRDLSGFIDAEKYAGQADIANGEFGAVAGCRFISTPEASIDVGTGGNPAGNLRDSTTVGAADLYTTLIFGMDASGSVSLDVNLIQETYMAGDDIPGIIVINKAKGSAGVGDPLDEVASMGWKAWHAGTVLNSAWGRGLRSGASNLT